MEKSSADFGQRFGAAIRAARTARGWTQGDIADRLDVKRASVSLWEGGQVPGPINLRALRELLGADLVDPPDPLSDRDLNYWHKRVTDAAQKLAEAQAAHDALLDDMAAAIGPQNPLAAEAAEAVRQSAAAATPAASTTPVARRRRG